MCSARGWLKSNTTIEDQENARNKKKKTGRGKDEEVLVPDNWLKKEVPGQARVQSLGAICSAAGSIQPQM